MENEEDQNMEEGCYPCGKPCAYCHLLEKSQEKTKSVQDSSMRNMQIKNITYLFTCVEHNYKVLDTVPNLKPRSQGHNAFFV